jgi:hypothetical protein
LQEVISKSKTIRYRIVGLLKIYFTITSLAVISN